MNDTGLLFKFFANRYYVPEFLIAASIVNKGSGNQKEVIFDLFFVFRLFQKLV